MQFDQLKRRQFIALLGGAAAAWPIAARAQQPVMALVGLLSSAQLDDRQIGAIRQGLKDAGHIEGRNVAIKYRLGRWSLRPIAVSGGEFSASSGAPDLYERWSAGSGAAKVATKTIPIVFVASELQIEPSTQLVGIRSLEYAHAHQLV